MSTSAAAAAVGGISSQSTSTSTDTAALAGRILIATLFLLSGFGKLAAPAATIQFFGSLGLPFPIVAYLGSVAVEVGVTLVLLLGYRTKLAAAILAVFTLATAAVAHAHFGDQDQFIHFFKNVAITGGLLQIVAFGGGRFSLDGRTR